MNQRQIIILIGHFCAAAALQSLFEWGARSGYRLS
jgi:hypothetical protein